MAQHARSRLGTAHALLLACVFSASTAAQQPLDARSRADAIEKVAAVIEREYFDKDVAARMAHALRTRALKDRYAVADSWPALASLLARDLFEVSKDKHVGVRALPADTKAGRASPADARDVRVRRTNYGVQRIEVLAGNVGYLNLTSFYRPEEAIEALSATMRLLRGSDALIVDMRENGGGSPDTVAWLLSYFFDTTDLPLFEIVLRSGTGRRYATSMVPRLDKNKDRPTYVLTSTRTFSGGEGFPFILQERRRALVIGEQTAGAANVSAPYPAGTSLEVTVPNGQVRTSVTGRNWEGVGVKPDMIVQASDALRVAHLHALRELIKSAEDGSWRQTLQRHLTSLEQGAHKR